MKYVIKLFDTPVISFESNPELIISKDYISNVRIIEPSLVPFGFTGDVWKWLGTRTIPKNREFIDKVLKELFNHIPVSVLSIIKVTKGLSLNDAYWVLSEDDAALKFSDYNLYDNEFDTVLSLIAFTGHSSKISELRTTPELTTGGMLPKCWHRESDGIYLLKGGTSGAANTGNEPYSEYYACQVANAMGLNAVYYDLIKYHSILASKCKLFTSIFKGYVPFYQISNETGLIEIINTEPIASKAFTDMIIFDAVICNTDRHLGNFGFLYDSSTKKLLSAAPIFDNGMSLFNFAMSDDLEDVVEYSKTRVNAWNLDQVETARAIMGAEQKAMLRKLIGFEFKRHDNDNLPEWRLKAIEGFIQIRVRELLDITNKTSVFVK